MDPFFTVASKESGLQSTWDGEQAIAWMLEAVETWADRHPDPESCSDAEILRFWDEKPEFGTHDMDTSDRIARAATDLATEIFGDARDLLNDRLFQLKANPLAMLARMMRENREPGIQILSLNDLMGFNPDEELRGLNP